MTESTPTRPYYTDDSVVLYHGDEPDFTAYYHCRPCRHHWYTGWGE